MPIRIELFAKDIKSATEVVEYALSMDCALVSYAEVIKSAIKAYNPKAKRTGPVQSFEISCGNKNPFNDGSVRNRVWRAAKKKWTTEPVVITRMEFNVFLRNNKIEAADAASIYKGFQDKGILKPRERA